MKKVLIVLSFIVGLTQLTAAQPAPATPFEALLADITPRTSAFPGLKNTYKHLVPPFFKSPYIQQALRKYESPQPSLASRLGEISLITSLLIAAKTDLSKMSLACFLASATTLDQGRMALTLSPAMVAYFVYRHYYPTVRGVYASPVAANTPITDLHLTIRLQKNGWLEPLTFNINAPSDVQGYAVFLPELQRDLTAQEKATTGDNGAGNVALLQQDHTYTFFISGTVTYHNGQTYQLTQERIIQTQRDDRDEWIELFWRKNIATRIASVWQPLPHDLISDRTAIYHALVSDTTTNTVLYSLSACGKEAFKDLVIEKLADEIFPTTQKQLEIKFSVTHGKHHFRLAPLNLAINAPGSDPAIYEGLQRSIFNPQLRAAQRAYALQLWNISGEPALATIDAAVPLNSTQKTSTTLVWAGTTATVAVLLNKLNKSEILWPVICAGLGTAALIKMHTIYTAHKEAYH
jgi:hypothetical protein